jgi:hypothetical protein
MERNETKGEKNLNIDETRGREMCQKQLQDKSSKKFGMERGLASAAE